MRLGFLESFLDIILPPRCAVTGEIVNGQGLMSPEGWRDLDFISEPLCKVCGVPFDFDTEGELLCASCLAETPPYDRARSVVVYNDKSRGIILKFKYADHLHTVPTLAGWLQKTGGEFLSQADIIIPVPLHRGRLFSRRYNQSALLAKALAARTKKPFVPDLLQRIRATPPQGKLDYKARYKNVKSAFSLNERYMPDLGGKTIVLVDDVYTSGATAKECTKVLKEAGAEKVFVLALARVVKAKGRDF